MNMEDKIKAAIESNFDVHALKIVNESAKHAGHAGDDGSGQTHFKPIIVSDDFENQNRVQRQRSVNSAISQCFEEGLHAISMNLKTKKE